MRFLSHRVWYSPLWYSYGRAAVVYRIATERDYLRADLFNRETAEEAREFFDAVAASATRHHRTRILISVHSSSAIFTVERSGFLTRFTNIGVDPSHKIALVADDQDLNHSHEYFVLLGRQRGINVRQFCDEPSALEWFRGAQ
jgi:hypothetical protein